MKEISRNVIRDLLPVYVAGEASRETRSLVEEFLAKDPELRELAEAEGSPLPQLALKVDSDELEKRALDRTCRLLSKMNVLMGVSLVLSTVPLIIRGFVYGSQSIPVGGLEPWIVAMTIAVAGASIGWGLFFRICQRLQVTGLQPPRGWGRRILWGYTGFLFSLAVGTVIISWMGWSWDRVPVYAMFGGLVFVMLGERFGQVPTPEDIAKPISLFDRE